ncbi:MAG: hypothetical protein FWC59_00790 [Actinomycetia bacterium]|nr:hypothetical protein [Actinomycetes bacterium]
MQTSRKSLASRVTIAGLAMLLTLGGVLLLTPTPALAVPVPVANETDLIAAVSAAGTTPTTIELTADIDLTAALLIGAGQDITLTGDFTLTQTTAQRAITVGTGGSTGATLTLDGPTITHTSGVIGSGVVVNAGSTCYLESGAITDNTLSNVGSGGAGVYVSGNGSFTMNGGEINGNSAYFGGGLFVAPGGEATLNGGVIHDNTALDSGGGVGNEGVITLDGTLIDNNQAVINGGGIENFSGTLTFHTGTVSNNQAEYGGGIWNNGLSGSTATLFEDGGIISHNTASNLGGGVYSTSGDMTVNNTLIEFNSASNGGGIYFQSPSSTLILTGDSEISNTATERGGGLFIDAADFTMESGYIADNSAVYGGGIYMTTPGGIMLLTGDSITNNQATGTVDTEGFGGGVYTVAALTDENCLIDGNSANFGGGIFIATDNEATAQISSGEFVGNSALTNGGAIWIAYAELANLTVDAGVTFSDNLAAVAYDRNPVDDAVYAANILGTAWSFPLPQGYNNWDIAYTNGDPVPFFTVTFDPGTRGTFAAVSYPDIMRGLYTPVAPTPTGQAGWVFLGWAPALSNTVTGNVVYVAQWGTQIPPTGDSPLTLLPIFLVLLGCITIAVALLAKPDRRIGCI